MAINLSLKRKPTAPRAIDVTSSNRLLRNPWYGEVIIYTVLFFAGVVTILPIWLIVVRSFSPTNIIARYPFLLWPIDPTLDAYTYIFGTPTLLVSFGITVFITVVGTALNLMMTILAAYGLSKREIPFNGLLMGFIVFAMLFSAGIVPTFMVVRQLGLFDQIWALIIPQLVNPFNLILMRNYFWSVPPELEESAKIDGASDLRILFNIVLPLSMPAIATIGLFYAVGHWNEFFGALFYINDNSKWPLQLLLRSIIIENNFQNMGSAGGWGEVHIRMINPENIKAATIVFATVPILMVYPFLQHYFVQGVKLGAIKG
ncbi:MAG: carbohydrate ABC transporter permease [Chloroflexi bacterium]|nr:carbohydrate ABC transporter permease [Chloroflexota bacterium]